MVKNTSSGVNFPKLRGRIIEKFDTLGSFAKAWGKSASYVSGKLNGSIGFTFSDVAEWQELLDIACEEVGSYFFAKEVQNI